MALNKVSTNKIFGGFQNVYSHYSSTLKCQMQFAAFIPSSDKAKLPVIYWLSGLTCNELNFIQKAGAQRYAAEHQVILVCPDTSPRGVPMPGDSDSWDFGQGAGFYVNATEEPWAKHYKMFDYVTEELVDVCSAQLPIDKERMSIMGHSMGGHGALISALKKPLQYKFVSAFAPICNPMVCAWGKKAFAGYLGTNDWTQWDATELIKRYTGAQKIDILIDQGTTDQFLVGAENQMQGDNLIAACEASGKVNVEYRMQDGYDHSYFFIATFIGEHIARHAKKLYE